MIVETSKKFHLRKVNFHSQSLIPYAPSVIKDMLKFPTKATLSYHG